MENELLSIKYRPQNFKEFFGSDGIKKSILKNLGTVHLYLFHGQKGCGKTTLARLVGYELGVDNFEMHEMDAASHRGIDDAKTLRSGIFMKPMRGERKMYIIDECHMLTREAAPVWLKPTEEPPEHVYFAFCTTEIGKVLPTIRSRAKAGEYQVKSLSRREMHGLLSWVCVEEKLDVDKDVYNAVLAGGEGIPRDTLGLLEKVKGLTKGQALELAIAGGMEDISVLELCRLLLDVKTSRWARARKILQGIDEEPEKVRRAVLGYMSKVMLGEDIPRAAAIVCEEFADNLFDTGRSGLALAVYRCCLRLK